MECYVLEEELTHEEEKIIYQVILLLYLIANAKLANLKEMFNYDNNFVEILF